MNATLSTSISQYIELNLDTQCLDEGKGSPIRLILRPDRLSSMLEINMPCRIKYPNKHVRQVYVQNIVHYNGDLVVYCF